MTKLRKKEEKILKRAFALIDEANAQTREYKLTVESSLKVIDKQGVLIEKQSAEIAKLHAELADRRSLLSQEPVSPLIQ